MGFVYLVSIIKDCGTKMTEQEKKAFDEWWRKLYREHMNRTGWTTMQMESVSRQAWEKALEYRDQEALKIERWNGVIK